MSDRPQLGLLRIERETVQERVHTALQGRLMSVGFGLRVRVASDFFDAREGCGTNFHVEIVNALARRDGEAAS